LPKVENNPPQAPTKHGYKRNLIARFTQTNLTSAKRKVLK